MLMPGTVISFGDSVGKYRFIAEAATGGMGIIYLAARHGPAGFSQLVAVKELRPEFAQDPSFVAMFLEEGRSAARFSHPNIVQTLETDQCDGRYFIAMEYLEGRSLQRVTQKFQARGGLPTWMSLSILCDVLAALDYVHELTDADGRPLGFVHRDVSPQNIFVTFDGYTKVIDFGIAKSRDSAQQTQNGVLKGRLCYMAPEQLAHDASRRSDLFSVGVILFELVTGRRLWEGRSDVDIFGSLGRGEIPTPQSMLVDAPAPLLQICGKALAPRPDDRYSSAAEMREALADYLWKSGPRELRVAQAIGNAITDAFGAERERTRLLIRTYFAQLERGHRGPLQKLALHERTGTGIPIAVPAMSPLVLAGDDFADFECKTVETPAIFFTTGAILRRMWAKYGIVGAATASATLLIALLIGFWPRHGGKAVAVAEPIPRPVSAPVAITAPQPAPALPETIVLSVTASPANAQVFIDGQAMPSNPFLGRFPTGTETHRIRVVAPGYLPKERLVSFADNVMLDLSLNPRPEPPPPKRREPPPPRHAPQAIAPAPTPTVTPVTDILPRTSADRSRKRRIDVSNPYEEDQ